MARVQTYTEERFWPNSAISRDRRRMNATSDDLHKTQALTRNPNHEISVDLRDHGTVNAVGTTLRIADGHPRCKRAADGESVGIALLERTHVQILPRAPGASCYYQDRGCDPKG